MPRKSSAANKLFEKAVVAKEKGEHKKALELFQQLTGKPEWGEAARYELAILLHGLGRHAEGDKEASSLGFLWRLNNSIFSAGKDITKRSSGHKNAVAYDGALPAPLLNDLRKVFGADSDFWGCHGYPTDQFFSYNAPGNVDGSASKKRKTSGKGGKGTTAPPGGALLRALAKTLANLARETMGDVDPQSFEWWAHKRDGSCCGHQVMPCFQGQLHFDLDEVRVREGEGYPHPLVSCVVFLEGSGGPTLVTDVEVGGDPAAVPSSTALLCPPGPGRVLLFNGSLLHGVVPTALDISGTEAPRITLMVGLWAPGVRTTSNTKHLGPNMSAVSTSMMGEWVDMCNKNPTACEALQKYPKPAKVLIPAGRCWVKIKASSNKGKEESDLVDVGRFMIRVEPEDLPDLCLGVNPDSVPVSTLAAGGVQSITLEELKALRGET